MKKIEKEIKVTRYVAFDGTEFETEHECMNYEGSEFATQLKYIENEILGTETICRSAINGHYYNRWYWIVMRNRTDVRVINTILNMPDEEPEVVANGGDEGKLLLLAVSLSCNTVGDAALFRIDDIIKEKTNGAFTVVSTIKPEERKK
ncbi:MAG: hypothetical protein J6X18_08565 [Bacteroidales bacterium]|nr:hypothetical protein [Bacteroidales bacterium]